MQTDVSMGYFYCISKKARPNRLHDQHSAVRFESEDGVTVAELPPLQIQNIHKARIMIL